MSAYYQTQPTPSHHHSQKSRGYRLCDQCGTAENPAASRKFRLCGGCMTTQYCSGECQKLHWEGHKRICQHTTDTVASVKQHAYPGTDNLAKELRKFTSHHNCMLAWSAVHGLQAMRLPANIRQQALLIELQPKNSSDPSRRFSVKRTAVVPRSYVTDQDPLVAEDIQRREDRSRRNGGLGTAIVLIQCAGVSQVMPVELDRVSWSLQKDWANVVCHCVDTARSNADFEQSISSNGLFLG